MTHKIVKIGANLLQRNNLKFNEKQLGSCMYFKSLQIEKNLNFAKKFAPFLPSKGMQNTRQKHLNPFFYDVTKSRNSVVMIVGVFEKQLSKKYATKFSKLHKTLQNEKM